MSRAFGPNARLPFVAVDGASVGGAAAASSFWNTGADRGDGTVRMVPVVSLRSVLAAVPRGIPVALLKSDMQGADFAAIKSAGVALLREKVSMIATEVWMGGVRSYQHDGNDNGHGNDDQQPAAAAAATAAAAAAPPPVGNDLCKDWVPWMLGEAGYRLTALVPVEGDRAWTIAIPDMQATVDDPAAYCRGEARVAPDSPAANGFAEADAFWIRDDIPMDWAKRPPVRKEEWVGPWTLK